MDHPAESRLEWQLGIVTRVYPDTWEVDARLLHVTSSEVRRARVNGVFLPELHTKERPSHVLIGWLDAYQQGPVAIPVHNTNIPEALRKDHVYWSEHMAYRITIKEPAHQGKTVAGLVGELEIRNQKGPLLQLRILEQDGVIRIDTPKTRAVFKDSDGSIDIHCDGDLTADVGGNADVTVAGNTTVSVAGNVDATVGGNATATVTGNVEVTAAGAMKLTAPTILLTGAVTIAGTLDIP